MVILHCQAHGKVVDFLEFLAGAIIYARPPGHARPVVKLLKLFFLLYCLQHSLAAATHLFLSIVAVRRNCKLAARGSISFRDWKTFAPVADVILYITQPQMP